MANQYNNGNIDIEAATRSILDNGGGKSEHTNSDGSTHHTVYSTSENRHLSYDQDSDGNVYNVHTDKDNHAYMDYKGGK